MTESSVTMRLLDLIEAMSEEEQIALLAELEEKLGAGKRRAQRAAYATVVDYSVGDRFYTDYIQDLSTGGVFIQTRRPFSVGQEILLSFSLPKDDQVVKITGEVARITSRGIGVKFGILDENQEAMLKTILRPEPGPGR